MKLCLFGILAGLCLLQFCSSYRHRYSDKKVADKTFLSQQLKVLKLLKYINQPSYYKEICDIAKSYNISQNINLYKKPEAAKYFLQLFEYGLLPKGAVFSVYNFEHVKQAKAVFHLLYFAENFDVFYKTAAWARQHLNEGLFLYSFSVAVVHREDTAYITLPPIYEIYPNYFFSSEAIQQADYYKQISISKNEDSYTIYSNNSDRFLSLNPDQSLAYYLEDVGINAFYYYLNLYFPYWLCADEYGSRYLRRGEWYHFVHQQLLAKYNLERSSYGLGSVQSFSWDLPFKTGYNPSLRYPNGVEFPSRPNSVNLKEYLYNYGRNWCSKYGYGYSYIQDYSRRLRDAIDRGYAVSSKPGSVPVDLYVDGGIDALGNLIQSNPQSSSKRYYGSLDAAARHLLGYSYPSVDNVKLAPSALEHFETSLRDPAFYQLYRKITGYFQRYQYNLPSYNKEQLYFPGISIENLEFSKLETFFKLFYSDVSNGVRVTPQEAVNDTIYIKIQQYRLSHEPFTYKLQINSDHAQVQEASVRVYIGPKYDEYGRPIKINHKRLNFAQFDYFRYNLTSGLNVINRNCEQLYEYGKDQTTYQELYARVLRAYQGKDKYYLEKPESYFAFPKRYALPRGNKAGQLYQFYIIVSPYAPSEYPKKGSLKNDYQHDVLANSFVEKYAFGYPFDRPIDETVFYSIPNSYFHVEPIYYRPPIVYHGH